MNCSSKRVPYWHNDELTNIAAIVLSEVYYDAHVAVKSLYMQQPVLTMDVA